MAKATREGRGEKEEESATDVAAHLLIGASRPRAASRAQKAKVVVYVLPSVSTVPLLPPLSPLLSASPTYFPSTCRVLSLACVTQCLSFSQFRCIPAMVSSFPFCFSSVYSSEIIALLFCTMYFFRMCDDVMHVNAIIYVSYTFLKKGLQL